MAEAVVARGARTAPKVGSRKAAKPSGVPVVFLTVLFAVVVHVLLCLATGAAADKVEWHPFGIDANVMFGEAQFILNGIVSFVPFDLFFGFCFAVLTGFALRVPFFRDRVYHTISDLKKRLMVQLSASQEEVESILRNDPDNNQRLLSRREDINLESVESEIEYINIGQRYLEGKGGFMGGISTYMKFHFVEHYANTVQGLAYAGAAFLIIVVGIRGLKFIPAIKPSPILFALGVEFSMLCLLALSLLYTEEEERIDRILKQMVDAVKGGKGKAAVAAMEEEESMLSRSDYEKIIRDQLDQKIVSILQEKDQDAVRRLALDLVAKR
ncbi:MAG TPA: hypothetical protein VFO76_12935 [Candidatus Kapabacteria bacterium]|nr:hypothetical protein [Candidatus Kapabacteria bacterium]